MSITWLPLMGGARTAGGCPGGGAGAVVAGAPVAVADAVVAGAAGAAGAVAGAVVAVAGGASVGAVVPGAAAEEEAVAPIIDSPSRARAKWFDRGLGMRGIVPETLIDGESLAISRHACGLIAAGRGIWR
jgi:hypothetical protein